MPPTHHLLDLASAARYVGLDEATLQALASAGFIAATSADGELRFEPADLKAFVARNADNGSGNILDADADEIDPQALLEALDGRSGEMARRSYEIFSAAFPEARSWSLAEQGRFVEQARSRFEAVLAITGQGSAVDEALVGDLEDVGAAAAWAGSPLPHLLATLRICRDLVVQTAVELAEDRGRHWGLALSLLLTRILPAMDRLTDSLAQGYWAALVGREEEQAARYQHVVETSSNGVFEVDLDGRIQYANPSLGVIVGRSVRDIVGALLSEVIVPSDPDEAVDPSATGGQHRLEVVRGDGSRRVIEVRTGARLRFDELVGYQGVVADLTAVHHLEAEKAAFLELVTRDLRAPLAGLLAQGANLEAHADELPPDQVARIGRAIRNQAERVARFADDLHDMSRLESAQLELRPRPVDLAHVVYSALASVRRPEHVDVRIPFGVEVLADARRLEQVVANLVDSGLSQGEPPVVISLDEAISDVHVRITLADPPPAPTTDRGRQMGLALARGLLEAMGGSVDLEPAGRGSRYVVSLQQPRRG